MGHWCHSFYYIGLAVVMKFVYEAVQFVYACFLRPSRDLKKYGEWAVVTGATDGIGKAMAIELSKKGMKVLLISRTQSRLDETKAELPGEAETLVIDFSDFNEKSRDKVRNAIKGKDVGVLINNVGISYDHPDFFDSLSSEDVDKVIRLNCDSTTHMTHICLPGMLAKNGNSNKGAIVNIASAAGVLPSVLLSQYTGAKSYIKAFSEALHYEYAPKGVHVQVQYPHLVVSKLSKVKKPSLLIPTADAYAKSAVRAIGFEASVSPYWMHYLFLDIARQFPAFVVARVTAMMHLPLRAAYYRKVERENKAK